MVEESSLDNQQPPLMIREVLKLRDFRLLWLAQVVSDFGDSLTTLALLMLVNQLTGSTAALATTLSMAAAASTASITTATPPRRRESASTLRQEP